MKIAVFSDTHDHISNTARAVDIAKELGITEGLHLGDFTSPPTIQLLAKSGLTWTCVWGNCDGDKLLPYRRTETLGTMDFADEDFREHEIDGRKLFLTHYPQVARIAALSGEFDAVFHGHNHEAKVETVKANNGKDVLLANPGELCAIKTGKASFGLYEPETNSFEIVWL